MQGALKQSSKADVISYLATHATAPEQPKLPSFGEKLATGYNPGATAFADQPGPASPMDRVAVRYLDQLGGAVLGLPSSIYHAVADDPTPQEEQAFQGHTRIPGQLAIERLTSAPLVRGAQQWADPNTRPTFGEAMSVLPEALGQG